MSQCFALVERHGRGGGVSWAALACPRRDSHYARTRELAKDIATLLDCTTWVRFRSRAHGRGRRAAPSTPNAPPRGFMILLEAGGARQETSRASIFTARVLPEHELLQRRVSTDWWTPACAPRSKKRRASSRYRAGVGTLDEIFETLALLQLKRIGHKSSRAVHRHELRWMLRRVVGIF